MAAVFNAAQTFGGAFNIANSKVKFGGLSADHLVQSIQYQYQQQISMLYELGSPNVYFNGGRSQGTANMSKMLIAKSNNDDFLRLYNDVCAPNDIVVTQASGCGPSKNTLSAALATTSTLKLQNAVMSSLSGTQDSQSAVFTEQMGFMFIGLDKTIGAAPDPAPAPAP